MSSIIPFIRHKGRKNKIFFLSATKNRILKAHSPGLFFRYARSFKVIVQKVL